MKNDASAPVIEVKNLTCGYGETVVLQDVSFAVHARELLFVIGGSGCGKSTLLRCLIGLLKPFQGDVVYFGKSFIAADPTQRREILKTFGVLYQNNALWSSMTLAENISLPLWYHSKRDIEETEKSVEYWLTMLAIDPAVCSDFMASPPHGVEPWQRKLAGLLRALVQMPRILVVDAGLFEDVKTRIAQVWIAALENYASQDRAVLVLADKATVLPWQKIE